MKFLNLDIQVRKVHSIWDCFRVNKPEIVAKTKRLVRPIKQVEIVKWELDISADKRMRTMHSDILKYAFRDMVQEMLMYPLDAESIFLGLISFTETFKNSMILKGASQEAVVSYEMSVEEHIIRTLSVLDAHNPQLTEHILQILED